MRYLDHEAVLKVLPDRIADSHKGDYGRILLLCGSRGFTGAAALAALGALRSGAGLVYLGVPESIYTIEAVKLNEPIVFPLADAGGMLSKESIPTIKAYLPRMDAVLAGPGLGAGQDIGLVIRMLLEEYDGPLVLDADGINTLKPHMDVLRGRKGPVILTPHEGEFARLGGKLTGDRFADATSFAALHNVILLLKGHLSLITDGNETYCNTTGNPGMAVGGSGDVLAGMITALLGQGIDPLEAAACGAWLHGKAGDLCARELGQYGMLPTDMLQILPRLLK